MPRAPRRCPGDNYTCPNRVTHTRYCPQHTEVWAGERSPSSWVTSSQQWKVLQPIILKRDGYQCRLQYEGVCTGYATTVDKIIPAWRRRELALEPSNLQAACDACNQHKNRKYDKKGR